MTQQITQLELMRLKAEEARVMAIRMENEVRIEELKASIEKLQKDIEISKTKEAELRAKITKG